jgi:hypothetical protein
MTSITASQVRAAVLGTLLAMVPASTGFGQSHKGHQAAKHSSSGQNQAQTAAKPAKATPHPHASPMNNQPIANQPRPSNAALASSLQSTRMQLAQADYDDKGHRTRALQEINDAIRLLGSQAGPLNTGNGGLTRSGSMAQSGNGNGTAKAISSRTVAGSGTKTATAQEKSEAQLLAAHQALQSIESRMDISGMNAHGYVQAKSSVQNAIRELNLALNGL